GPTSPAADGPGDPSSPSQPDADGGTGPAGAAKRHAAARADGPGGDVRDGGVQGGPMAVARRKAARAAAAAAERKRRAKHHSNDAPAAVKALGDVAKTVGKAAAVAAENADKSVFPGALLLIVLA